MGSMTADAADRRKRAEPDPVRGPARAAVRPPARHPWRNTARVFCTLRCVAYEGTRRVVVVVVVPVVLVLVVIATA